MVKVLVRRIPKKTDEKQKKIIFDEWNKSTLIKYQGKVNIKIISVKDLEKNK